MTADTAAQRLLRIADVLARAESDAANGWGSAANVRRLEEDRDAALRAFEEAEQGD